MHFLRLFYTAALVLNLQLATAYPAAPGPSLSEIGDAAHGNPGPSSSGGANPANGDPGSSSSGGGQIGQAADPAEPQGKGLCCYKC